MNFGTKIKDLRINTQLIQHAQDLGVAGVELFSAEELPLLKGTGLVCAATRSHTFVRGLNNQGHHPECFAALEKANRGHGCRWLPQCHDLHRHVRHFQQNQRQRRLTRRGHQKLPRRLQKNGQARRETEGHDGS